MTVNDLRARGFIHYATLPKAYTYCIRCDRYHYFGWWQAPSDGLHGAVQVAACDFCGTLTPFEASVAAKYPVIVGLPVLVEKR